LSPGLCTNHDILGTKLLIIGRQYEIAGVGRLDLLGIDQSGKLTIIELKRDRTPRDAVAQALDYASWPDSGIEETILDSAQGYLKHPWEQVFFDFFQTDLPDISCQNHGIILVAPRLDASAERIVNYLAERHRVDVNAVFFKYAKLIGGPGDLSPIPASCRCSAN
jgi:hypothetical protein